MLRDTGYRDTVRTLSCPERRAEERAGDTGYSVGNLQLQGTDPASIRKSPGSVAVINECPTSRTHIGAPARKSTLLC